jgi:hypothetical protein
MADEWDDFEWWEPYNPGNQSNESSEGTPSTAETQPTGLKSKSWGNSQGSTSMPGWYQDWLKGWFTQPSNNGITGTNIDGPPRNPNYSSRPSSNGAYMVDDKENYSATPNSGRTQGSQGMDWMKDTFMKYFSNGPEYQDKLDSLVGSLGDYYTNQYSQIPGLIDTQKQNIINSIYASAPRMNELYQPTLEDMSNRGILQSSVTSDSISKTNDAVQNDILSKVMDASTWAGNQQLGYVKETPGVLSQIMDAISNVGDRKTQFGQTTYSAANNYQNQIMQLLELLKNQNSQSTQGSEVYNV